MPDIQLIKTDKWFMRQIKGAKQKARVYNKCRLSKILCKH